MVIPNDTPIPYTFKFSDVPAMQKPGGTVKIVDSRTFKASKDIAAAEVTVEPGAMRLVVFLLYFLSLLINLLVESCTSVHAIF
jgi:hypothetical protein